MRKILFICALVMTLTTAYSQDQYIEPEKVNVSQAIEEISNANTAAEKVKAIQQALEEISNARKTRMTEYFKKHQREKIENELKEIENKIKIQTKVFIEKARKIHGNKYDYSKAEYLNAETKICIICPKHGEFWQTQDTHLKKKRGCPQCGLKRCNKGRKNGQKKH